MLYWVGVLVIGCVRVDVTECVLYWVGMLLDEYFF